MRARRQPVGSRCSRCRAEMCRAHAGLRCRAPLLRQDECNKYGSVIKLTIPRPTAEEPSPTGLGLVIIEYADMGAALQARQAMHGRKFGGHVVQGTFLTEADYAAGNFFSAS